VQSPFEAVLSGFKIGAAGAEAQAQAQAREKAATAQTELTALFNNPNATAADYARVTPFLPKDQDESVRKSFEMLTAEQQQSSLRNAAQVYSAVKSGQVDIAKNITEIDNKTVIYHENEHSNQEFYEHHWDKLTANLKYKNFYKFKPSRQYSRLIAKVVKDPNRKTFYYG
jgi:hypothetical protein